MNPESGRRTSKYLKVSQLQIFRRNRVNTLERKMWPLCKCSISRVCTYCFVRRTGCKKSSDQLHFARRYRNRRINQCGCNHGQWLWKNVYCQYTVWPKRPARGYCESRSISRIWCSLDYWWANISFRRYVWFLNGNQKIKTLDGIINDCGFIKTCRNKSAITTLSEGDRSHSVAFAVVR